MRRAPTLTTLLTIALATACSGTTGQDLADAGSAAPDAAWPFPLPDGFPPPPQPADNPATAAKAELGRHLFHDVRLSITADTSCATCHLQEKAFTDGAARSTGATGDMTPRGSMPLMNVAYAASLTWGNPLQETLEDQLLIPLFGTHPVEMGMAGRENEMLDLFATDPTYQRLFPEAFPGDASPFTLIRMAQAIAVFERTLISGTSPWDRFQSTGDPGAISASARRGSILFFTERLECYHCHGGFLFTDHGGPLGPAGGKPFHNNGLYNLDGMGLYPAENQGVFEITQRPGDMGRFKAPSLRNIALTAPYMHDGSLATLDDVIDHYAAGGRTIATGPNAGVGKDNPNKSSLLKGFELTPDERADLLAFLQSLTDDAFVQDPAFANPWASATP